MAKHLRSTTQLVAPARESPSRARQGQVAWPGLLSLDGLVSPTITQNNASMSQASNAVVFALICGLILFIVLPHALAALDRWRFLKRLRRAFESGALQPLWPSDAAVCPCEIKDLCQVWMTSSVVFGNDEIDLVRVLSAFLARHTHL